MGQREKTKVVKHLTTEQIISYIDKSETVNLDGISAHLDKCPECAKKLREEASYNLSLNFASMQKSLEKERALLKGCLSIEAMLDFIRGVLSEEEKSIAESHVSRCKRCKEEIELTKLVEPLPEVFPPETSKAGEMLLNTLRCFKLVAIALEREKLAEAKEAVKESILEKIRRLLFPPELVPVPISFSERKEPGMEFYRELNDEELAVACVRGHENAWQVLMDRFTGLAFHVCEKWGLREHRENVWQDSLAVLLRKIRNFKKGDLSSFIAKIVYYKCREKRRELEKGGNILSLNSHIKEGEVSFEEALGPEQVPDKFRHLFYHEVEENIISKEILDMIESAIERLPEDFKEVIKNRYIEGMSVNEVSRKLEVPIKTVLTRILRGKAKLFEIMKKEYPELREEIKGREWIVKNFKTFLDLGE
jgi:RNA polymerase sigma-70 factor (ECF subfamily)